MECDGEKLSKDGDNDDEILKNVKMASNGEPMIIIH